MLLALRPLYTFCLLNLFRVYRLYEHDDRAQPVHAGEHPFIVIAHPCPFWLKEFAAGERCDHCFYGLPCKLA